MCEYCGDNKSKISQIRDEGNFILEFRNIDTHSEDKYQAGIEALQKAFNQSPDSYLGEVAAYRAQRDLEAELEDAIEKGLVKLYKQISEKWLGLKKAEEDEGEPMKLNGRTFINPETGEPLTNQEWKEIKKDLTEAFGDLFEDKEDRMVKTAMAMGKLLNGMDVDAALDTPLRDMEDDIQGHIGDLNKKPYRNQYRFAKQHAGELITDLTDRSYRKIHDTIVNAQKNQYSTKDLESNLFDKFAEMNRDWRRIAETETAMNLNNGYLLAEKEKSKEGENVFMRGISAPGACPFCSSEIDGKTFVLLDGPPSGGGDKVVVDEQQYTAIWPGKNNFGRKRSNWWVAVPAHPHTYSKDTEVFTDSGWKFFPDLNSDDKIMALDPETYETDFVNYTRFVEHPQEEMIRLYGRNFDLMVTPEHRQLYRTKGGTTPVKEAAMGDIIRNKSFELPRAIHKWQRGEYTPIHDLDMYTYAKLWAWFLSDGSAVDRGGNLLQVHIPQKDNTNIKEDLGEILSREGWVRAPFKELFRDYCGVWAHKKWIPESVKNLPEGGIRAFLEAYTHADGHNRKGKKAHKTSYSNEVYGDSMIVYTTSKQLANDLTEVVVKAGWLPSFSTQEPGGEYRKFPNGWYKSKKAMYIIGICKSKYRGFDSRRDKGIIETIQYNDTAYDVELERWHHLLVRRNGKTAWSGNCRCTLQREDPGMGDYFDKIDKKLQQASEEKEKQKESSKGFFS